MRKRQKMGWIGWIFISVLLITFIVITLLFSNLLNLNLRPGSEEDSKGSVPNDEVSDETKQKVKEVQDTIGKEHQEIGNLIAKTHKFYNKTTGYGAINSLDWDEQKKEAELLSSQLDKQLPEITNEALLKDLEQLQELADQVLIDEEKETVIHIHRLVHDLDIALNDYSDYDKIWNVTETLKVPSN